MRLTFLGCGTSTGVPVIGCDCPVCTSTDPKNARTRSSLLVSIDSKDPSRNIPRNILIDTSPDFRTQAIREGLRRVDAVLYTHYHADHVHGIDDLRSFNRIQNEEPIPCYGTTETMDSITSAFAYIFSTPGARNQQLGWKPNLTANTFDCPFELFGTDIIPVEIKHGRATVTGFRIGNGAYLTDCSSIPDESKELLHGLDLLILGALRNNPHPAHLSIPEAVEISGELKPKRTILTHIGHSVDSANQSPVLPEGVEYAYDGLSIEL